MDTGSESKAVNEGKAMLERGVVLPPILRLPPVDTDQLELHALDRYLGFLQELYKEVPLDQLSDEDLTDDEQAKRKPCVDGIIDWVQKCNRDAGDAALLVYPYSTAVIGDMSNLKNLMRLVYERKMEKARQEAEKKQRLAALEEMDPPLDDAEKYLTPEERQKFFDSIPGAIDAYLDTSEEAKSYNHRIWLLNKKASDYSYWTSIIEEQKEKEAHRRRVELEQNQCIVRMNKAISGFKQEIHHLKKPPFSYPASFLAGYRPWSWCELKLPTKHAIARWAEESYISKKIPPELREFVSSDIEWQTQALPHAMYELLGVPCLTWYFGVRVLVEGHLRIVERKFVREFHGEKRQMKIGAEELGTIYVGPADYGVVRGFITPVALLATLAKGKLEEEGIAVVQQGGSSITFRVGGYDEELVTVKKDFRQFVMDVSKDEGLAQGLLSAWVIDKLTAQLIEEKAKLPLPQLVGAQASAGESTVDNSDVLGALQSMGFKTAESKEAIEAAHFSPEMNLEQKVMAVLKIMGA